MRDPEQEPRLHVLAIGAVGIGVAALVGYCVMTLEPIYAAYASLGIGLVIGRWF